MTLMVTLSNIELVFCFSILGPHIMLVLPPIALLVPFAVMFWQTIVLVGPPIESAGSPVGLVRQPVVLVGPPVVFVGPHVVFEILPITVGKTKPFCLFLLRVLVSFENWAHLNNVCGLIRDVRRALYHCTMDMSPL